MRYSPTDWLVSKARDIRKGLGVGCWVLVKSLPRTNPNPQPLLFLLTHQLAPVADGHGEGDGGAAVGEAGVEDGDDAAVVVEDGPARVARPRGVDLQLVGVADDADRGLVGAGRPLRAAVDAADVADRHRRVGNLDALRLGVHRIHRLDDAVDRLRNRRVAE